MLDHLLRALALLLLFALADFLTGRSWKRMGWPTRSIYGVAPVVMGILGTASHLAHQSLILNLEWASVGLGWACWRCLLGWSSFGGSMDPQTPRQTWAELERNTVSIAVPLVAIMLLTRHLLTPLLGMVAFALVATAVAVWYGAENRKGHDVDPEVDLLHGAAFGVILAMLT